MTTYAIGEPCDDTWIIGAGTAAPAAKGSPMTLLKSFLRDETGSTAIEYGLIAAIIAVGLIAALSSIKGNLQAKFNKVSTAINTAN